MPRVVAGRTGIAGEPARTRPTQLDQRGARGVGAWTGRCAIDCRRAALRYASCADEQAHADRTPARVGCGRGSRERGDASVVIRCKCEKSFLHQVHRQHGTSAAGCGVFRVCSSSVDPTAPALRAGLLVCTPERAGQLAPTSSESAALLEAWSKLRVKSITYSQSLVKPIIGPRSDAAKRRPAAARDQAEEPQPAPAVQNLVVESDAAGQRLDNYLLRLLKGVPKTHVYRLIRSGQVRVNGARVTAETRLEGGARLRLPPVRTSVRAALKAREISRHGAMSSEGGGLAPARTFASLLQDEHLWALDKPAGLAVHGGSGVAFGLIEQLRMAEPGERFLELVHRLDRETSGILLVARRRQALRHLQEQFRDRGTDKIYLALVRGHWPERLKVIDQPLLKTELEDGQRQVRVVAKSHPQGMRAITLIKIRSRLSRPEAGEFTLLEVTLRTGRTHQIRVHLASAGYPIAGDDKYGDFILNRQLQKMPTPSLPRMFLHAWRLSFDHPHDGRRVQLCAQLPADLQAFIDHATPAQL